MPTAYASSVEKDEEIMAKRLTYTANQKPYDGLQQKGCYPV